MNVKYLYESIHANTDAYVQIMRVAYCDLAFGKEREVANLHLRLDRTYMPSDNYYQIEMHFYQTWKPLSEKLLRRLCMQHRVHLREGDLVS